MKALLTTDELIDHMKKKGITFNIMSEHDAKQFLENNNYYMKLASYRANYQKSASGRNAGQYVNLDFAYLRELSTIDMHIRYFIVEMCLDIEHALKVRLLDQISKNSEEDGYEIVKKFLAKDQNIKLLKSIQLHRSSGYVQELIDKYYPFFPAWVFVEVISFGTLLFFCRFYEETYGTKIIPNNNLMNNVRDLRNAAAHSNCLLNHLSQKIDSSKQPDADVTHFIKNVKTISYTSRQNKLSSLFVYNIVSLLYTYDSLVPSVAKQKRFAELKRFINGRACRNGSYFKKNTNITSVYEFFKKVLDTLAP